MTKQKDTTAFLTVLGILRWYMGVVSVFTRLKPKCSLLIVMLSFLSRIFQLGLFLLPIKMLFFLGSPSYQPVKILSYEFATKESLAFFLVAVVVLVMVLSVLTDKISLSREESCSKDIWQTNRKLVFFANQEDIATTIYHRYILTLSSLGFVATVLGVLGYVYPLVGFILIVYMGAAALLLTTLSDWSETFAQRLREDLSKFVTAAASVGFLFVFLGLVYEFIAGESDVELIVAVISLILVRQLSTQVTTALMGIRFLHNKKEQLEVIFLSGQVGHKKKSGHKERQFLELLDPVACHQWMQKAVSEALGYEVTVRSHAWIELGLPNELMFAVQTESAESAGRFYVKLFNKNLHSKAIREAVILNSGVRRGGTLELLGSVAVDGFQCNVFAFEPLTPLSSEALGGVKEELVRDMALSELPDGLLQQYLGTHKLIHERLTSEFFFRLKIAADEEEVMLLEAFAGAYESIVERLETLPLRLVLPHIGANVLAEAPEGVRLLSHSNWFIEPLGYGFSSSPGSLEVLRETIEQLNREAEGQRVEFAAARMVSGLAELEGSINRYAYKAAFETIQSVLELHSGGE